MFSKASDLTVEEGDFTRHRRKWSRKTDIDEYSAGGLCGIKVIFFWKENPLSRPVLGSVLRILPVFSRILRWGRLLVWTIEENMAIAKNVEQMTQLGSKKDREEFKTALTQYRFENDSKLIRTLIRGTTTGPYCHGMVKPKLCYWMNIMQRSIPRPVKWPWIDAKIVKAMIWTTFDDYAWYESCNRIWQSFDQRLPRWLWMIRKKKNLTAKDLMRLSIRIVVKLLVSTNWF